MATQTPIVVPVICMALVFYWIGLIVYRLTWHPLAKYPGPFLAKITPWYDVYHSYLHDRHIDQYRCQQKYGNVYRYSPDYLVINTAQGLADIYTNAKTHNIQKGKLYVANHDHGAVSTHSVVDRDVHAFRRRVLGHAFSEASLRNLEPFMIKNIEKWLPALGSGADDDRKGWSEPKNMANWANYLTFDVLGDLCFGKPFGMLDSDNHIDIPKLMLQRAQMLQIVGNSPMIKQYKFVQETTSLEKYVFPKVAESMARMREFAAGALKERFAQGAEAEKNGEEPRKDFIYFLQQGKDPDSGKGLSQFELLVELRLLIVAGSDTSSVTMAAAFFYLSRHPEALERLQKELRSTFDNVDDIVSGQKLSSCKYLRAVIEETLRLAPPVPSSLPREICRGGMTVDGHPLTGGITVGSSAFTIHRSDEYYKEPLKFKPERWLPEHTSADEISVAKSAFCAFSLGNRGCIGKPMAYGELSLALGRALWLYDVRLSPGDKTGEDSDGLYTLGDVFVSERYGPYIEFRKHAQTV